MRPLFVVAIVLAACAAQKHKPAAPAPKAPGEGTPSGIEAPPAAAGFGSSKETAIEVCDPSGERAYLNRLRCADGAAPRFQRSGSVGSRNPVPSGDEQRAMEQMGRALEPGETDYHVIDLYEVACTDRAVEIFMDMYHCDGDPPKEAPPGFAVE